MKPWIYNLTVDLPFQALSNRKQTVLVRNVVLLKTEYAESCNPFMQEGEMCYELQQTSHLCLTINATDFPTLDLE